MYHTQNTLQYLEHENCKTVDLSVFKGKNPPKRIIEDLTPKINAIKKVEVVKKAEVKQEPNKNFNNLIEKKTRPLKTIGLTGNKSKSKPTVWL